MPARLTSSRSAHLLALLLLTAPGCGTPAIDPGHSGRDVVLADATGSDAPDPTRDAADPATPADSSTPSDAPGTPPITAPPPVLEPSDPGPLDDPCHTLTPTIRGNPASPTIVGTAGRDVIFAFGAAYEIHALGGDDVICTGAGDDTVYGGPGNDYIDTGYGNDTAYGDSEMPGADDGDDTIHGRAGSDHLFGGGGRDAIYGDLLDDDLYGEGGDDVLVGGHGTDYLHGGDGNDYLRGDTGHDTFVGGAGVDTASFMTAAPPLNGGLAPGDATTFDGVVVDLTARLARDEGAAQALADHNAADLIATADVASGDGAREALAGIEVVVGSAFDDRLVGDSDTVRLYGGAGDDRLAGPAGATLDGGPGQDTCRGAPCDDPGEPLARPAAGGFVFVDDSARDTGLLALGGRGADDDEFTIAMRGTVARVTGPTGRALTAGEHCIVPDPASPNVVECALPHAMRYVLGYGGDGRDTFTIATALPRDVTTHVYGGNGDDTLTGGPGEDVLFSGPTGADTLRGLGGDDALLSESQANVQTTRGADYTDGADTLDAGDGDDQLVADYPCGGHHYVGGDGIDIAGFRRSSPAGLSSYQGITAQLGGPVDPSHRQAFYGRAFMPGLCAFDPYGTTLAGDLEILEAGEGDDHLFGNDLPNTIWAWGGDDQVYGFGGDDELAGDQGNDELYGGDGRDALFGYDGADTLHAREASGAADRVIDCGGAGGDVLADRDPSDPAARGCH